ncbi:hypothetical protein AA309_31180 [Microvirga vignae]|uniref:Uncharacterized protein n=1 Tax=Microvirga vignae TaxID=1225564 RepID=A0A0H1R377_9HYPH|nr:hypothetical protein AA309_31180 [Microvirga vignae]
MLNDPILDCTPQFTNHPGHFIGMVLERRRICHNLKLGGKGRFEGCLPLVGLSTDRSILARVIISCTKPS